MLSKPIQDEKSRSKRGFDPVHIGHLRLFKKQKIWRSFNRDFKQR